MIKLRPNKVTSIQASTSTDMSIAMAIQLRHISSLFCQLFVIVSVTLTPSTLNVRNGAFMFASAVSASSSSSSSTSSSTSPSSSSAAAAAASAVAAESNYELHAAHISIDSIMMTVDNNNDLSQLTFEPNYLHFDELSVGETANKVVTIFNRHANRSVYLGSISGSVSDFYSSFFEENLVPPMGNTTFTVVFLPRQQALIQAHLIIHTSFGVLNYEVKGRGVECPYRLSPLVGLKSPLNATLLPEIIMYNPYDTPLQIVEVYSSGGQFQLELPQTEDDSGDAVTAHPKGTQTSTATTKSSTKNSNSEQSQKLWEIPPFTAKSVIRVRFTATHAGNSTAYIRIKVSARKNAALEKSIIVLPIEVEIFKEHGLYSSMPFLNFGLSGTNDKPKSVTFRLVNSGNELNEIETYSVEAEENIKNGITLELNTVRGEIANETYHTMTATVTWSRISAEQFFRGNILIQTGRAIDTPSTKTKRLHYYRIPFVGGLLRGAIQYNESLTRFHLATATATVPIPSTLSAQQIDESIKLQTVRDFRIKNNFDVTLAITNLTMSPDTLIYFRAENFKSKLLAPGGEAIIFQIVQQPAAAVHSVTRSFHLHTNVSVYDIELFSFNGLLKRLLPITDQTKDIDAIGMVDEKSINFGILPLSTQSQIMLALINTNPIAINIHNWKGTISSAAHIGITVPGCSKLTMKGLKFCNIVKPGEWIVFQISVTSNTVGTFEGKFTVQTDYEVISTPIRFSTDMGTLKFATKLIDSNNCFPGGICNVNLTAYSTFSRSMHIKTIQANSICLKNVSKIDSTSAIELHNFNGHECHVTNLSRVGGDGQTLSNIIMYEDGEKPVIAAQGKSFIDQLTIEIPKICDEKCALDAIQIEEKSTAETQRQRFQLLKQQLDRFHELSAKFQQLTFHVQTNHIKRYDFNGSIDIVWSKLVKGPIEFEISQVGQELTKQIDIFNPFDSTLQIHYQIHDPHQKLPLDIIDGYSDAILTDDSVFSFGINKNQSTIVTVLPKTHDQITIKFMSQSPGTYGTLLYIYNNFTVLEAVWISAKAVIPQFKFGNRKPGSKTPLLFELTDKHLRDCNHPNVNMRAVTAKRTFTAKNSGEVPIFMRELRIDDMPCEGYGYRILECTPFELPPNGSRKIEISFTPDFTLAMVKKTLYLETSINYSVNYTLLSMIAPLSLGVCSKALARPEWESVMKNVTAVVLAVSFVCVLFAAYLDSMKVLKVHVDNLSKAKGALQPALDLRQIGLKSLFSEDTTKNGSNSICTLSSNSGSANKQNGSSSSLACNAKTNGSICKKKTTDKKRTSCSSTETVTPKKSYITEIAKKFTPKKSESKQKLEQLKPKSSPPASSKSTAVATTIVSTTTSPLNTTAVTSTNKREKRIKDDSVTTNFEEEEETSSTTTESSTHSDDKSNSVKSKLKKSSQSKDLTNAFPHSKDKKIAVNKTKSLPLNYSSANVESSLTVPLLSSIEKSSDNSSDGQSSPFEISQAMSDDSLKSSNLSDESPIIGTPPTKFNTNNLLNGKTPGRERNKNNLPMSQRRAFNADNVSFKMNAFEFSSPLAESPTNGNHPLLDLMEKSQNDPPFVHDQASGERSKSTLPIPSTIN